MSHAIALMFEHDKDLILHGQSHARADAVRNHHLILETAQRLFQQFGVEAVSMSQIAQEAHVGKGTLYRNFANKVELCYALLDQEQRDLQEATLRRLRQSADAPENLRWFLGQALDFVLRNEALLDAGSVEGRAITLEVRAHLWWRQTILNLLRQMNACGDTEYTADALYVLLHVNTIRFQRYSLNYSPQRIKDGLTATAERLTTHCM